MTTWQKSKQPKTTSWSFFCQAFFAYSITEGNFCSSLLQNIWQWTKGTFWKLFAWSFKGITFCWAFQRTGSMEHRLSGASAFHTLNQSHNAQLGYTALWLVEYPERKLVLRKAGISKSYAKGQLISKGLFGILEFFQRTNERIRF